MVGHDWVADQMANLFAPFQWWLGVRDSAGFPMEHYRLGDVSRFQDYVTALRNLSGATENQKFLFALFFLNFVLSVPLMLVTGLSHYRALNGETNYRSNTDASGFRRVIVLRSLPLWSQLLLIAGCYATFMILSYEYLVTVDSYVARSVVAYAFLALTYVFTALVFLVHACMLGFLIPEVLDRFGLFAYLARRAKR